MDDNTAPQEYRYPTEELRYNVDTGVVEGVVMRYGDTARVPTLMGIFSETVTPGAFGSVDDVTLNISHDKKRVFARTGGGGLELQDTDEALRMRATLPDTTEGRDAREYLTSGVLRGLSVEMRIEPDGEKLSKTGGLNTRTIERAKLNGIALVDRPAYGDSQAILKRFEVLIDEEVLAEAAVEHRFESEYYYDSVETISDDGDVRKREISPGAFDVSIRDPSQEITLSIGRNPNDAIGSKLAGTLTLDMVDDRLVARVDNPPETSLFRDLQARIAVGNSLYMEPLFRELDGEYTDVDEPGNPGVKIRRYNSVKLYGLGLSVRGKKGQGASGEPPGDNRWLQECLGVSGMDLQGS